MRNLTGNLEQRIGQARRQDRDKARLRAIIMNHFEYMDSGKLDKAERIQDKLRKRIANPA